jgi:hypothetical protein
MREMTKTVDTVPKQEHRAFLRAGEDSPLTGTKYVWLFSAECLPEQASPRLTLRRSPRSAALRALSRLPGFRGAAEKLRTVSAESTRRARS